MELITLLLERRTPGTRDEIFVQIAAYGLERRMAASDRIVGPGTSPEAARRKFERDKDELRRCGLLIETVRIAGGGNTTGQIGYVLRPSLDRPRRLIVSPAAEPADPVEPEAWEITEKELAVIDRCLARLAVLHRNPLQAAAASAQRAINTGGIDPELGGQGPIRLMPQEQLAVQVALALDSKGARLAERLAGGGSTADDPGGV